MGRLTLPESGLVYLDADTIIYSVEHIPPYYQLLEPVWLAAQSGQIAIVGSELLLVETLIKPVQVGDTGLAKLFNDLLLRSADVDLRPIDRAVLQQAIQLRATENLKTPDAIHAATALLAGCALFLTNDRVFSRIPQLNVTVLSDLID